MTVLARCGCVNLVYRFTIVTRWPVNLTHGTQGYQVHHICRPFEVWYPPLPNMSEAVRHHTKAITLSNFLPLSPDVIWGQPEIEIKTTLRTGQNESTSNDSRNQRRKTLIKGSHLIEDAYVSINIARKLKTKLISSHMRWPTWHTLVSGPMDRTCSISDTNLKQIWLSNYACLSK